MPLLKPYLIRASYDWIIDCNLTPHLLIDGDNQLSTLPMELVENGRIILNIRPAAVQNLILGNDHIEFDARFHGNAMHVHAPIAAVLAIFAQENGEGMFFEQQQDSPQPPPIKTTPTKKANLRVIK